MLCFRSFKNRYSNIYFGNKNAEIFSKSKNYVSALSSDVFSLDTPNLVPPKGQDFLYLLFEPNMSNGEGVSFRSH